MKYRPLSGCLHCSLSDVTPGQHLGLLLSLWSPLQVQACASLLWAAEARGRGTRTQELIGVLWFSVMDPWSHQ